MSYYKYHVFFCCNLRSDGESSCGDHHANDAQTYAKERIAELKLKGPGKVRINKAGCMGRCDEGPLLVVYPDAIWYRYANTRDVEEIIQEHLLNGRVVERLRI
ncbi:ferredoxin [Betaproteobacteria bacterium]|nr:ferredoxin [Betaproteobacteria bacterium]